MEETKKYFINSNKLKKPKLGLNIKDFILFILIILLISSSLLIYILLKKLRNFSINNIEKKLILSQKFSQIYSILFDAMRILYKPSSGTSNHNYNIKKNKGNKGIGICAICKNENLYLKEYATYYQKLGIKKIIIYDNNEIDGEKPEDILDNFIKNNFIEIIDIRGFRISQIPSYNHCYEKYRNQFDYIAFLDFDEFIIIQNNRSINDYLYDAKFDKCESILLNWEMYGDNDLVKYDNRTMIERFKKPAQKWNMGKSIVRTNIDNLLIISVHNIGFNVNFFCDSNGKKIIPPSYFGFTPPRKPESYIKHFYTKTAEEFCMKIKRGGGHFNNGHPKYNNFLKVKIHVFKKFNKISSEKRDIIKNCSGLMNF